MKTELIKKLSRLFISVFVLTFFAVEIGFSQGPNTPYPIIFVHGLNSDNTTWGVEDGQFDNIVDYLDGAGLKFGGNLNIALSYKRSPTTLSVPISQDVMLFNQPSTGDYYTINFDVHANGFEPITHSSGPLVVQPVVTNLLGITNTDPTSQFDVTYPDEFVTNDIIRVDDEFMQVTDVNGSTLTVNRGVCNSKPALHIPTPFDNLIVWNLSDESNQASIAKQGYALKLAIDAIKLKTGAKKVILVGHSMGGLAARDYIKKYSNNDVAKIVTIGTPHYGTDITDLPNSILGLINVDGRSDAIRDLRANLQEIFPIQGVYLFGGYENTIKQTYNYYSGDVNGNGTQNDAIEGLNSNNGYKSLNNIARTWIASSYIPPFRLLPQFDDGIVPIQNQYISSNDTLMTNRFHTAEPNDYYNLLRGLDEPDDPALAYEISGNSITKGFITYNRGYGPLDVDLFKIVIKSKSTLKVNISGSQYSGILLVNILNSDQGVLQTVAGVNQSMTQDLEAGTYYVQVNGAPTLGDNPTYKYPYTLTTTTTVIPPPTFTVSPASTSYYDVILNQSRSKTITLTNSGATDVSVSNLSLTGTNADQFSIIGQTSYTLAAGQSQAIVVKFSPKSTGAKSAALQITSNSADNPVENIALSGSGTDHATRTLTVTNDISYNYGDLTITTRKSKIFTLQNTGSDPMTVTSVAVSGQNASEFSITNPPTVPFDLPSGGTKSVTVSFLPATIGTKAASLDITNNSDNDSPVHSIVLFGNGTNSVYTGITQNIVDYEYWFDANYSARVRTSLSAQNLAFTSANFPTTGLNTGPHTLNIRYLDKNGQWSSVLSKIFYKPRKIISYEYWFDNNYAAKIDMPVVATQTAAINTNINTKSITSGSHTLNIRYLDDDGQWGSVKSQLFYKPSKIASYEYWFDNNYTGKVTIPVTRAPTTVTSVNINTKSIASGKHSYNIRYQDDVGQWSAVATQAFYKPAKIINYEYWFDNNYTAKVSVPVTPTQTTVINRNIVATALQAGVHNYNVRFEDGDGEWSCVTTSSINILSKIANLANLNLSTGTLIPVFNSLTTGYTALVGNSVTSITVTPITSDANATVKINGTPVISGVASAAIPLTIGSNTITTVVTAQDGVTTQTYTVIVTRAASINDNLSAIKLTPSVTLTAVTGPDYKDYTASVSNAVSSIQVTPTTAVSTTTVTVNGVTVTSGTASGAIPLGVGPNIITVIATAQDGVSTHSYVITVNRAPSTDATLSALSLSSGTLSPVFKSTTASYAASVAAAISAVTITPTTNNPGATITINGSVVATGTASMSIPLNIGSNVITTVVTAQDGKTQKNYIITVNRGSNNAYLTNLKISSGTLSPAFQYLTNSYTTSVANTITFITVTPVLADPTATVTVNGNVVTSKAASPAIHLHAGVNNINVIVTAQNGVATDGYTIAVTRAPSNNDNLVNLAISSGTLTPAFAAGTLNYAASVSYATASVTVTPTVSDPDATITVNGVMAVNGSKSKVIPLTVGSNIINTVVTASDGMTSQTYTLVVTRFSNNALLSKLTTVAPAVTLTTVTGPGFKNYTASVANTVSNIKINPTTSDPNATVTVNGVAVISGTPSSAIALTVGANTITTIVTAQDGTTTNTYIITITRAGAANIPDQSLSGAGTAVADDGINVHQGISPNGDGLNDFLKIDGIANYPENKLTIMNRNGTLVYEAKGYDNQNKVFDGHSNKNGQMQLPGTYFYSLDYTVKGVAKHKTGFLVLKY